MLFNFNNKKNNNKIILHKINGETKLVSSIKWLNIKFKGKDSVIEVYEPYCFRRAIGKRCSAIKINGDNNYICIKPNKSKISTLKIIEIGSNNKIFIGENLRTTGLCKIDFANQNNLELRIGDNCLFGQHIEMMLGDWHSIYDDNDNCINKPQKGISIGNNVWLARNITILKDASVADNSVVGYGSVVTKQFLTPNIIIAGSPAKVVKENIHWDAKNT